ncbi:MAG: LCP family protein [Patescibacteria group bacterium]
MKKIISLWYVPVAILAGVVVLYAGLIGYRVMSGGQVSGGENNDSGQTSFWTNFTNSIGLNTQKLKGENKGRVNVLVVGVAGGDNVAPDLTDTVIFASVNIKEKKVSMFSIPRDLYLEIPGFGYNKINSAYSLGKNYQVAGGGMGTLIDTVKVVTGQDIDYYVKIDFDGFVQAVDALGGIDVVVDEDIYDYLYPDEMGGYELFALDAGPQHLDGVTALKFVRSRQTTSDFDRAKRQQKALVAMKDAFLDQGIVGGTKVLIQLIDIVSDHLETDLQVSEWERAATIIKDIGDDLAIDMHVFDNTAEGFLVDGDVNGMYVLQPYAGDFEDIHQFVDNILSGDNEKVNNSQVHFEVLNGTNRVGLAGSFADVLTKKGYSVDLIDNTMETSPESTVSCKKKDYLDETIKYLEDEWGVRFDSFLSDDKIVDCTLVLGNNFNLE